MTERRVLFFDGSKATAMRWSAGRVTVEGGFRNDPAGMEEFSVYLDGHKRSLFYLLADVAEEGFQLESIPAVSGNDRTTMIKRRLGQYFYGTPLSVGISLGRGASGRRDERLLFAALTRPESLKPWIDALQAAEVALAGVFSVPLVLAEGAEQFLGRKDRFLLLTLSSAGLRQTYFDDGQMHFSRLTPIDDVGGERFATLCQGEASKTYQYLLGQRKISRGTRLNAVLLADPARFESMRPHLVDSPEIQFESMDAVAVAKRAGLKQPLDGARLDALLVHRMMARTPRHQFVPSDALKLYRLWQLRFASGAAAIAIFLASLVIAGRFGIQAYELDSKTSTLVDASSADQRRYQGILDSLPKISLTPENLRQLIAGFDALKARAAGPEPLLQTLGAVLEATPAVELERIDWRLAAQFQSSNTATVSKVAGEVKGGGPWFLLDLKARLPRSLASDQRAQVDAVNAFIAALEARGLQVALTKQVIDVESGKSFRSKLGDTASPDNAPAPSFALLLGKKVAP